MAAPAYAQPGSFPQGADDGLSTQIKGRGGEVIVVGRKREERIVDSPVSISTFNADYLQARSADDLSFLDGAVPNTNFDTGTFGIASDSVPTIHIRGIGQDDYLSTTDPGVGVYLNQVYLGRTIGQNLSTLDIAEVEVMRGPQGTLYGRNAIGGAINVRLRKPAETFEAVSRLKAGSDELIDMSARFDVPLSGKVRSSMSFGLRRRDGFAASPNARDIDFGNDRKMNLRHQLWASPTDRLEVSVISDWSRQREESEPAFVYGSNFEDPNTLVGLYNSFAFLLGRENITEADLNPLSMPDGISLTGPSRDDLDVWGTSLTLDWQVSDQFRVKAISAYRGIAAAIENDQDSLRQLGATFDARFRQRQFSQEIQVNYDSVDLNVVSGLYFFSERGKDDTHLSVVPGLFGLLESFPAPVIPLAPIPVGTNGQPAFSCPDVPAGFPCAGGPGNPLNVSLDQTVRLFSNIKSRNLAAYAHAVLQLAPSLSVSFGGRITSERKSFHGFQSKIESSQAIGSAIYNLPPQDQKASWTKFSPHLGISYQLSDTMLVYGSYDQGFRSGTFNGRANSLRAFTRVRPETVHTFEAGFKSELFDRNAWLAIAMFYSDYTDLQVRAVVPSASGVDVFFVNAAEARIAGFEAEFSWNNQRGLLVGGTLGFIDSELRKVDPVISAATGIKRGNALSKAPRFNGSAFAEYTFAQWGGLMSLRLDANWRSASQHDAANTIVAGVGTTREKAFARIDAGLSFDTADGKWRFAAWGKNLTNSTNYASLVANAGGLLVAYPVRRREWGMTIARFF